MLCKCCYSFSFEPRFRTEILFFEQRLNAATVLALNPRKINSYDSGMDLALRLIRQHVQQRSLAGLQTLIHYKIDLLLNDGVFSSQQQDASFSNNMQYPQKSKNRK